MRPTDEDEENVLLKKDENKGKGGRVKKTDEEDGSGYGMRQIPKKTPVVHLFGLRGPDPHRLI
jgi:hypothetical protein